MNIFLADQDVELLKSDIEEVMDAGLLTFADSFYHYTFIDKTGGQEPPVI